VLEVAIFYFLLALEAEKLVGQQISNPVLGRFFVVGVKVRITYTQSFIIPLDFG
jgi:hypothetical protein